MNKRYALLLSIALFSGGGCAAGDIRDSLWELFGGGYTAGGVNEADRNRHYQAQAERWNSPHSHYNPTLDQ
jgi:hypothetical protein